VGLHGRVRKEGGFVPWERLWRSHSVFVHAASRSARCATPRAYGGDLHSAEPSRVHGPDPAARPVRLARTDRALGAARQIRTHRTDSVG
jgi:hypothetical protein